MTFINLFSILYPVGSCYFSINDTSPASLIGGTWTKMTGGMLGLADSIGVADSGSDGGSRKISIEQMPAHSHAEHVSISASGLGNTGKAVSNQVNNYMTNEDWSIQPAGGGGLYPRSHFCLWLETYRLASSEVNS